jgi:hypothetical protein
MAAFENAIPIDDAMVVLDLMVKRWGDETSREICRWFPERGSYVEVGHHRDFSDSTIYRFRITEAVIDRMVGSGYLVGKPKWGYTEQRELLASDHGKTWLWEERKRLEAQETLRSDWWFERVKP